MRRVEDVYQVEAADGSVSIHADLKKTAAGIEQTWPGGGLGIGSSSSHLDHAQAPASPADVALPSPATLIRTGAWRGLPFLLRPLSAPSWPRRAPPAVADAVAIWTHVAGQTTAEAPARWPSSRRCCTASARTIPRADSTPCRPPWRRRPSRGGRVPVRDDRHRHPRERTSTGRRDRTGTTLEADAVVSNRNGVGTYLESAPDAVPAARDAGPKASRSSRPASVRTWPSAVIPRPPISASAPGRRTARW